MSDGHDDLWVDKRICVTGGSGFLGSFLLKRLEARGARSVFVPRVEQYDLVELDGIRRMLRDAQPEIVIHLAARVGGIGANRAHPAEFFYANVMMGVQLLHESWKAGVDKFVALGTVC
jgi:GDP-L-fucose synthase